jgi:CP family cyanate transporter-like MFS transporter
MLAECLPQQQPLTLTAGVLMLLGLYALLKGKDLWLSISAILTGMGTGMGFSLAMMLFPLRTRTPVDAAGLSAMAQGIG